MDIKRILNKRKEIDNCNDLIFEKENDILSCIKSINEKGIRIRQKEAAVSLLNLKNKKNKLNKELKELCKSFDFTSYNNKQLSSKMISSLISEGISVDDLKKAKEIFKNL